MDLSTLILKVRNGLSDIPVSYLDHSNVLNDLKRAEAYVDLIKLDDISDYNISKAIEILATYYCHVTWTALSERQLGEIPYATMQKSEQLKSIARSFLSLISKYPLNEDLSVDLSKIAGCPVAGGLTRSVLDYYGN